MSTLSEQLEVCFKKKDYDKAQSLIKSYFADATTDKGKNYFAMTTLYLELLNAIDEKYQLALQQTLDDLNSLNLVEKKIVEDEHITSVRKELE